MALVAGIVGSLALSWFLGIGFLWIGKPEGEVLVSVLFMFLAYSVSHWRGSRMALLATLAPAAPLALLLVQFRDPNDSHLMSIAIVMGWLAGAVIGAFAADRARTSYRRFLACIGIASLAHAAAALASLLISFGGAMQAFDGKTPAAGTSLADALSPWLLEPVYSLVAGAPMHLSPVAQWIGFTVNSLTWGIPLGVLLAGTLRLLHRTPAAAAG